MADRSSPRVSLGARARLAGAALAILIAAAPGAARAAEVKTSGHLDVPASEAVMAICTDPVVQHVLNQDFRLSKRSGAPHLVTVTINARVLGPGSSLDSIAPGDPAAIRLLHALGAHPPLGDTGTAPVNQFSNLARQQATMPLDSSTQQFRYGQAMQQTMSGAATSSYENIPQNQMYPTAIIARATIGGSPSVLHVVALVQPGDDLRMAKQLVAEEIADAILH